MRIHYVLNSLCLGVSMFLCFLAFIARSDASGCTPVGCAGGCGTPLANGQCNPTDPTRTCKGTGGASCQCQDSGNPASKQDPDAPPYVCNCAQFQSPSP